MYKNKFAKGIKSKVKCGSENFDTRGGFVINLFKCYNKHRSIAHKKTLICWKTEKKYTKVVDFRIESYIFCLHKKHVFVLLSDNFSRYVLHNKKNGKFAEQNLIKYFKCMIHHMK